MLIVIDLFGDSDDTIKIEQEDPEDIKRREEQRRLALEEIFRRSPQPQVVPVETER